ncbi:hypothetical protein [Hyphomicrobium sp.]|uniref:hypothetical protein n=1 Tax=Hyphomicrobium sp. TaxID=82 RepID=UPI0025C015D0|nr:hypothetical protein [Hyphomicrobium sp.]MCC7252363.1 hypothetical protein [Hyphomicrobium sp.]
MFGLWQRYTRRFGKISGTVLVVLFLVGVASQAQTLFLWGCSSLPWVGRHSGLSCPASPAKRPAVVEYQQKLADFRAAIASGDETSLTTLRRTDFKIQKDDLCQAAGWLSDRVGPEKLSESAAGIFLDSVSANHVCSSGSWMLRRGSVSLPVVLLDRGLFPHDDIGEDLKDAFEGCAVDRAAKYLPRQIDLIRRVIGQAGVPADFAEAVDRYRTLFARLNAAPSGDFVTACTRAVRADDTQAISVEFIYSEAACVGTSKLQQRWRLQKAYGRSDEEAAGHVCGGVGPIDLSSFDRELVQLVSR